MKDFSVIFKCDEYLEIIVKAEDKAAAEKEAHEEYRNGNCWCIENNIRIDSIKEI